MKKKIEAQKPVLPPLTIGDYVFTRISERAGKIIKAEDKLKEIGFMIFYPGME